MTTEASTHVVTTLKIRQLKPDECAWRWGPQPSDVAWLWPSDYAYSSRLVEHLAEDGLVLISNSDLRALLRQAGVEQRELIAQDFNGTGDMVISERGKETEYFSTERAQSLVKKTLKAPPRMGQTKRRNTRRK